MNYGPACCSFVMWTQTVAALLMRPRLRQRFSTKSMTTNPSVSQKNSVDYAAPDVAAAAFSSTFFSQVCVSAQTAFVAMAELERFKKKRNPSS